MIGGLSMAVIIISLVAAAWTLVPAVRNRPIGRSHLTALAVVEVGLLIQAVVAIVQLVRGEKAAEPALFIGYAIGSLVIVPVGGYLGSVERTRWGSVVAGVACLIIPVVIVRMQQLWQGPGV